jgi:hypothetical protein
MTNRKIAEVIYEDLNKRGANLGNAAIGIICKTLDEMQVKNHFIPDDSDRRKLLIDFCSKVEETLDEYRHLAPSEEFIDKYLNGNL